MITVNGAGVARPRGAGTGTVAGGTCDGASYAASDLTQEHSNRGAPMQNRDSARRFAGPTIGESQDRARRSMSDLLRGSIAGRADDRNHGREITPSDTGARVLAVGSDRQTRCRADPILAIAPSPLRSRGACPLRDETDRPTGGRCRPVRSLGRVRPRLGRTSASACSTARFGRSASACVTAD